MKAVAIFINLLAPGIGTLLMGKPFQGAVQIVLTICALVLVLTVWLTFFGLCLFTVVWIWALITGVRWKSQQLPIK